MTPLDPSAASAAIARSADPSGAELIAAVERLRDVDHLATAADFGPSTQARTAIELLHRVHALEELLDLAWAGAAVAQIFLQRPWLQSVDLEVSAESVYDDAGGGFVSHSLRFGSAVPVPGVRFPEEVAAQDGRTFDARAAAEELAIAFEDCACDFAAPFLLPNVVDTTTLRLERDRLAPLLAPGAAVSGLAVARLLWPDHEVIRCLLTMSRSRIRDGAPGARSTT